MAIRRVSELPSLDGTYSDADVSKCLIEVSYNPKDRVYQSFYVRAEWLIDKITERVVQSEWLIDKIAERVVQKIQAQG